MSLVNSPFFLASTGTEVSEGSSLRFENGDSAYLNWTPPSVGSSLTQTLSFWMKRTNEGNYIFRASEFYLYLIGDNLNYYDWRQGANGLILKTNAVYRDVSAWMHVVLTQDRGNATASDRIKLYVNGEQVTSFSTATYPNQNEGSYFNNSGNIHYMGGTSGNFFDGYLANVTFIDGQALDPTSFGEYDGTLWKPKSDTVIQALTFGTNGFYLPFDQTTEAEGFSTVTYSGSGADHSIEGVGFEPDFVWIKNRTFGTANNSYSHALFDSVRGVERYLNSNETSTETVSASFSLTSFDDNGFSISDGGTLTNASGSNYVAWCWDAGNAQNWAADFDGSDDDVTGTLSSAIGTGDFTLEYWVRHDTLTDYQTHFSITRGAGGFNVGTDASGDMVFYSSSSRQLESIGAISAGTWYHFAFVRNSGTLKGYVDGVELDSVANTTNFSATAFSIGALDSYTEFANCRISNLRLTNTAVYTAAFTPPTSNLTAISGTILLTLQDGSFKDNSGNNTVVNGNNGVYLAQNNNNSENTDGSITSSVKANTTNGFSIATYTGNGTAGATFGHGLGVAPDMVIVKRRDGANSWQVYTSMLGATKFLELHSNGAEQTATNRWNDTAPSSSVVTLGDNSNVNSNGGTCVAYSFASVSGYSDFGSYTGTGAAGNSITGLGFKPAFLMVKRTDAQTTYSNWWIQDSTRNPTNVGSKLNIAADTSAAETNALEIDFDSDGFTLQDGSQGSNISGATYIYMAFADTRDATFFGDTSGNDNNWTPNKLNNTDVMPDSPVTNFATYNPALPSSMVLSEGNLEATQASTTWVTTAATFAVSSGKWYWESKSTGGNYQMIGIVPDSYSNYTSYAGSTADSYSYYPFSGQATSFKFNNNAGTVYGNLGTIGDIFSVALDLDAGTLEFFKNNVSQGVAFTGLSGTFYPAVSNYTSDSIANFGQDSSFAGNETPQGNTDDNGQGDFYYAPPSGFLALNRNNLPAPTILDPADYFNTVLYTGDGTTDRDITGYDFQPDFLWHKARNKTYNHYLFDVVRGNSSLLKSNTTQAEYTSTTGFNNFISNGFNVDQVSGWEMNESGSTYANWGWLAGGTAVSNTDGSITSQVSANQDAGFSVVTYTGNATSGATVGHGLGVSPDMVIVKNRSAGSTSWPVYHNTMGTGDFLYLNSTQQQFTDTGVFNTAPTSSSIVLGSYSVTNGSGNDMIAYCFSEIEGYSKIGSYTGNGSIDGPFVHCGFRPAWIMFKRTDDSGSWFTFDNKRSGYNVDNDSLSPDLSTSEFDGAAFNFIDILSNGFKMRDTFSGRNASGGSYTFIAFAEAPFKNANAR